MSEFVPVAKTSDLSDPGRMLLEVEDRIVVLLKVGGEYFCIDDVWAHTTGEQPLDLAGGSALESRKDRLARGIGLRRHGDDQQRDE